MSFERRMSDEAYLSYFRGDSSQKGAIGMDTSNSEHPTAYDIYKRSVGRVELPPTFSLPPMATHMFHVDPVRVTFTLARYKFVARMFEGKDRVLEIGCADGFGTVLVAAKTTAVTAIDFHRPHIDDARRFVSPVASNIAFEVHDLVRGPVLPTFDAAYSIDVFEHLLPEESGEFLKNVVASLKPNGTFILGIPSIESQEYASVESARGHINCMSGKDLQSLCSKYFTNVFLFGMNDEVLHTGFSQMSHYLICLCVGTK
jgi:SAM-dependent methyltransferase